MDYPPRPLSPIVTPSYIRYSWDQLPYDASLAEALKDHPMPPQEGKLLLDILNESAEKNKASTATWKPGTLDVLAIAQASLETLDSLEIGDAIENTVKALPQMRDQKQAQEFTGKLVPLLLNWARKGTRKDLSENDFIKEKSLFYFVAEINELQRDNANSIGIQRALYKGLPQNVYEAFDHALPACNVQGLTRHLKQIGDKLLSSSELQSDLSFDRDEITECRDCAKQHFDAACTRMNEDIAREEAINQSPVAPEEGAAYIEVLEANGTHTPQRILSPSLSTASTPHLPPTNLPPSSSSSSLVAPLSSASEHPASPDVITNGNDTNMSPQPSFSLETPPDVTSLAQESPHASPTSTALIKWEHPSQELLANTSTDVEESVPNISPSLHPNVSSSHAVEETSALPAIPKQTPSNANGSLPEVTTSKDTAIVSEDVTAAKVAKEAIPQLFPEPQTEQVEAFGLRARNVVRPYPIRFLPGRLGSRYPTAFTTLNSMDENQPLSQDAANSQPFATFVAESNNSPKNIRVTAKPQFDQADLHAFTLTDSQSGVKADIRAAGALGAILANCSAPRSPLWNFTFDEQNKRWQARSAPSRACMQRGSITTVTYNSEKGSAERTSSKMVQGADRGRS